MTLLFRVTTKILIIVYHGFSLLNEFKKHYGTSRAAVKMHIGICATYNGYFTVFLLRNTDY